MLRMVPWADAGGMARLSTEWVAYMYPEMLVEFMVLMAEMGRAWKGEGALRAKPACWEESG